MKQCVVILLVLSSTAVSVDAHTFFKKAAAITGGTALAFAGHYLCEYMSTFCHELGHACAYTLISGNSAQILLQKGPHPLAPWIGLTSMSAFKGESKAKHATITAAGPIAGIGTTLAQIYLLQALEDKLTQQQTGTSHPVSIRAYFKNLYEEAQAVTTTFLTEGKTPDFFENPLLVASKLLKFLRYSRVVGESLYGFTPISVPQGVGDGQKLWSWLLNREDQEKMVVTDRLATITGTIMLSPILLGTFKVLRKKQPN